MRVSVKLFAGLVRYRPGAAAGAPFEVELPAGARVRDLLEHLRLPPEEARLTFINGRACLPDYPLAPGDSVGVFPPIGGG